MFRLRRTNPDLRLDITPMIDVVFLLLTFFLFAFVVMVRARTLDVNLPDTGRVTEGQQRATITLSLAKDRRLALDGEEIRADSGAIIADEDRFAATVARVQRLLIDEPDARVLLAADRDAPSGDLLELIDALTAAGITEFSVLGRQTGAGVDSVAAPEVTDAPAAVSGGVP